MSNLKIERKFPVPAEKLFHFLTTQDRVQEWFGPEGMSCPEICFEMKSGASWFAVLENADGGQVKVSGVITQVDPPHSAQFTWGWHSEDDVRGSQSNVRFQIDAAGEAASILTIIQTGLPDEESVTNHNTGWTSSLVKLAGLLE